MLQQQQQMMLIQIITLDHRVFTLMMQELVGVVNPFTNTTDALISYNEGGSGSQWVRGVRSTGTMTTAGNTVYTTNLTGNYPDLTKSYLVSQCYNLSNVVNPQISFAMKYDLEQNSGISFMLNILQTLELLGPF
jgi:hypothetical protein